MRRGEAERQFNRGRRRPVPRRPHVPDERREPDVRAEIRTPPDSDPGPPEAWRRHPPAVAAAPEGRQAHGARQERGVNTVGGAERAHDAGPGVGRAGLAVRVRRPHEHQQPHDARPRRRRRPHHQRHPVYHRLRPCPRLLIGDARASAPRPFGEGVLPEDHPMDGYYGDEMHGHGQRARRNWSRHGTLG